jgi:hypothetical protein
MLINHLRNQENYVASVYCDILLMLAAPGKRAHESVGSSLVICPSNSKPLITFESQREHLKVVMIKAAVRYV